MDDLNKHIEEMMKPFREIEKMMEPTRKLQKQISETGIAFAKAIEPTLEFQKSLQRINKLCSLSIPKFENPIKKYSDIFKEIGERLAEYVERTPEYFLLIAQNGWFIDLESELNLPSKIASRIQNNELETANELLIEYYTANLDKIFKKLIKRHPDRKTILEQIETSFKEGRHIVLIPTVLTQIDGICFDFTKRKFFIKEKKNNFLPQVTSELEKSAGNFLDLYLSPIQNQTPIMVREQDISKFPCQLNRHKILHGISTDYGTKINSLKVISLLKYVSDLLTDLDKKNTKHNSGYAPGGKPVFG